MSVESLWGQIIATPGTVSIVCCGIKSGNMICHWESNCAMKRFRYRNWHSRFYNKLGRWRKTNATEGGDQKTREKCKVTDSSMILPSACLSWFVYWEKKASHLCIIKTQPGFSRDFISKSSLDAEANAHQWLRQSLWNISWMFRTLAVLICRKKKKKDMQKCKVTSVFISSLCFFFFFFLQYKHWSREWVTMQLSPIIPPQPCPQPVYKPGMTHTSMLTLEYMAPLRTSPLRIQMIEAAGLALSAWQVRLSGSPALRLTTGPPLMTGSSGGTIDTDTNKEAAISHMTTIW